MQTSAQYLGCLLPRNLVQWTKGDDTADADTVAISHSVQYSAHDGNVLLVRYLKLF